jgi:hypothetical protein
MSYITALFDLEPKTHIIGYFVADDKPLTADPTEALQQPTLIRAASDALLCNQQWQIDPFQSFLVIHLAEATMLPASPSPTPPIWIDHSK